MFAFLIVILAVVVLVGAVSTARAIWYVKSGQRDLDQRMVRGYSE